MLGRLGSGQQGTEAPPHDTRSRGPCQARGALVVAANCGSVRGVKLRTSKTAQQQRDSHKGLADLLVVAHCQVELLLPQLARCNNYTVITVCSTFTAYRYSVTGYTRTRGRGAGRGVQLHGDCVNASLYL